MVGERSARALRVYSPGASLKRAAVLERPFMRALRKPVKKVSICPRRIPLLAKLGSPARSAA